MSLKRLGMRAIGAAVVGGGLLGVAAPGVSSQSTDAEESAGDAGPVYELESTTVISAAKLPVPIGRVGASISVIDRAELRNTPSQSVPDILSSAAGLHTYDFAGNGMAASTESRGFAAQRETSHLQFLLDGLPFMDFADDNALWNLLDLDQLERIEVLKSASSALHGNTAFTGVVNLVPAVPRDRWSVRARVGGGSHGRLDLTQTAGWRMDAWSGSLSARFRQVDGWRDHSKWSGGSGYGSARIPLGTPGRSPEARVGVLYGQSDAELPGPLPKDLLDADPTAATTPLDRDESTRVHAVAALGSAPESDNPFRLAIQVSHEDRQAIETVLDTQEESRLATVLAGQATWRLGVFDDDGVTAEVLAGVEGSVGKMDSEFRAVDGGGAVGAILADGDVHRNELSEYLRLEVGIDGLWSIAAGLRRDDLWSELDPASGDPSGAIARDREMNAWSPNASVNYQWRGDDGVSTVSAFAQVGRSFKTPTLVQLYELRQIDIDGPGGIPPFSLSSASLDPQFADQVEFGVRGTLSRMLDFDVAIYGLRTEDEIGFDFSTFSFANIGETTHRGFEAMLAVTPVPGLRLHAGHAFSRADFDEAYASLDATIVGNQINNVPLYMTRGGVDCTYGDFLSFGARVLNVRDQWIDEQNEIPLPNYTTVDLYGELGYRDQSLYVKALNVLDETYATSGFVSADAMGAPLPVFFPGPERRVEGGIRIRWR